MGSINKPVILKVAEYLAFYIHILVMASNSLMKAISFGGAALAVYFGFGWSFWKSVGLSFSLYLATGGWRYTKVVLVTAPRDVLALFGLVKIRLNMTYRRRKNISIIEDFDATVAKHPNKVALIMANGDSWTFAEVQRYSLQIASWLRSEGYQPGDAIALLMMGCPQYVCWWIAMARISVIPALINFNLRNESLVHCITVAKAKAVVYGTELTEAVQDIQKSISGIALYSTGSPTPAPGQHVDDCIKAMQPTPPPSSVRPHNSDILLYIYTSGTTGLPKPAIIKHYRFFYMAYSSGLMFGIKSHDIIYDTLPLYHSAGGVLGIGQMIMRGCTVVVRPKFSASQYWQECIKYNCTAGQYIGETCRYLLAQPPKPTDTQHSVVRMYGNGIRPQIWREFQQRFNIKHIIEFYGATEGNSNLVNYTGTVGAIGFTTRIAPFLYPVSLIKVDSITGEPIRDKYGMCIHCCPGERGELVGKIGNTQIRRFDGYAGSEDKTLKKMARNVFTKGDHAFLTGDILEMDEYGYFYFKDRTGDTFRWKGENVSTLEVEAVIHNILQYKDAVVYGVEVPGNEGRAGMAAIANDDSIDLDQLYKRLQTALPAYARPVFVRLLDKVDTTGTFKLIKKNYQEQAFNPSAMTDHVYYLDAKAASYRLIDTNIYTQICEGKIRL